MTLGTEGARRTSMGSRFALLVALACGVALTGCRRDGSIRHVEDRLAAAGLRVDPFRKVKPDRIAARACRRGKVERLDVVLCSFDDPRGPSRIANLAEAWADGAVTTAWSERPGDDGRSLVLVVADRDKVDLDGQAAERVLEAFAAAR